MPLRCSRRFRLAVGNMFGISLRQPSEVLRQCFVNVRMRFTSCQRCVSDNTLSHGAIHSFPFVIVQESEPSVSASVSFLSVKFAGLGVSRCDLLSRSPKPHIEARLQLLSGTRNSDKQSVRKTEAWHQGIKCLIVRSLPDVRSGGCSHGRGYGRPSRRSQGEHGALSRTCCPIQCSRNTELCCFLWRSTGSPAGRSGRPQSNGKLVAIRWSCPHGVIHTILIVFEVLAVC